MDLRVDAFGIASFTNHCIKVDLRVDALGTASFTNHDHGSKFLVRKCREAPPKSIHMMRSLDVAVLLKTNTSSINIFLTLFLNKSIIFISYTIYFLQDFFNFLILLFGASKAALSHNPSIICQRPDKYLFYPDKECKGSSRTRSCLNSMNTLPYYVSLG